MTALLWVALLAAVAAGAYVWAAWGELTDGARALIDDMRSGQGDEW